MSIDVQCSACGKRLRAPDEQAGRKGRCPACKAELLIPANTIASNNLPPVRKQTAALSDSTVVSTPPPIHERNSVADNQQNAGTRGDFDAGAKAEITLDGKHWFALRTALQVTKNALLLSWISFGLLGLALIGTTLASRSTGGDTVLSQAITLLLVWGIAGTLLGWMILFSGWLMCLLAWPAVERRLLHISIGVTVFLMIVLIISPSLQIFGIGDESKAVKVAITKTVPSIVFGLTTAAALIAFGYFLAGLQVRLGNECRPREPLVRAIVIGMLMLWCISANLFFEPTVQWKAWMIVLSDLAAFFTPFVWLWLLNVHVSGHLQVSQAWKRL